MDWPDASPGVIFFTTAAVIAGLYAFVCHIREERVARAAVKVVRETHPAAWQSVNWVYRWLAGPSITIRMLHTRHGISDPHFALQVDLVKRLERQKLIALGAAFLCIALMLIGTEFWGWSWD